MNSDPTIIEGSSPVADPRPDVAPTIIEPGAATAAPGIASINLNPGERFLDCELLAPIKVVSGEADLWVARRADGRQVVLKLYRWGLRPKAELTEKLAAICRSHIVEVLAQGVAADGRHYELLEYIAHGSLADLAQSGLAEPQIRAVLAELTEAVAALHAGNILHRDLKPANVLVHTVEPLNLVLTDFGISSVAQLTLHVTGVQRTAAYGAPEAMTGVVSKASDWWSVGVIVLELLQRRHPFAELDERAVNFTLVTRGIEVPASLPADWQLLLKGLLTRDHAHRWGAEQVRAWIGGKRDIPVQYHQPLAAAPARAAHKVYRFAGKDHLTAEDLAVALGSNWTEGVKQLERGLVLEWIKNQIYDQQLTSTLTDITEDRRLDRDSKLAVGLLALNPQLPLTWKGEVVNRAWLPGNPSVSVAILASTIPEWLAELRSDRSLLELREWRDRVLARIKAAGVSCDRALIDRLIVSPPEAVMAVGREMRATYAGSTNRHLDPLFRREPLPLEDAILLATCARELLQTAAQKRFANGMTSLRAYGVPMDWTVAEALLRTEEVERTRTLCAAAIRDWPRREGTDRPVFAHQQAKSRSAEIREGQAGSQKPPELNLAKPVAQMSFLELVAILAAAGPARAAAEVERREQEKELEIERVERRRRRAASLKRWGVVAGVSVTIVATLAIVKANADAQRARREALSNARAVAEAEARAAAEALAAAARAKADSEAEAKARAEAESKATFSNSLGMKFAPVPGTEVPLVLPTVLFSV